MEKVCRLGLAQLFLELQEILLTTEVLVLNEKQANGAGRVREMIDEQFGNYSDWVQSKTGDVDWVSIQPDYFVEDGSRDSGFR